MYFVSPDQVLINPVQTRDCFFKNHPIGKKSANDFLAPVFGLHNRN